MSSDYEPTSELRWEKRYSWSNGRERIDYILTHKWARPVFELRSDGPDGLNGAYYKTYSKSDYQWREVTG